MQEKFWLVWNPARSVPTFRHPTEQAAITEANRLAEKCIGEQFFVLEVMGLSMTERPEAAFRIIARDNISEPLSLAIAALDRLTKRVDALEKPEPEEPWLPEGEGWIEWSGGENPVPGAKVQWVTECERRYRHSRPAIAASEALNWGEGIVAYRVEEPAKPARVLKHGEYQPGDRVRYTARGLGAPLSWIGRVGVIECVSQDGRSSSVRFDNSGNDALCSHASLEHESLPQFEVGDRVRLKRGTVTGVIYGFYSDRAALSCELTGSARLSDLELVRPVQAERERIVPRYSGED